MTTIYLVRHGETDNNKKHIILLFIHNNNGGLYGT